MFLYILKLHGLVHYDTSQTLSLYSMKAPLGGADSGSSPSLPWKGKSSKSTLTRSRAGTGAACHLGVRGLTGALRSPQNRAGWEGGDFGNILQDTHRPGDLRVVVCVRVCTCDYTRVYILCMKQVETNFVLTEKLLPALTPFCRHQKTTFREQTGSLVPQE